MNRIVGFLFLVAVFCSVGFAEAYPGVTEKVTQVATGFKFTEGPALAPDGDIYFTDIPNSKIHVWSKTGRLSVFREKTGRANGLLFDSKGNLLVCEGGNRRLTSIDPDGKLTILADIYKGKKLNSPNDLWMDSKGGVYFTDPRYWKRDNMELAGEDVYYISPSGGGLKLVIDDLVRPNGIIGTPDGKTLYVADRSGKKTFSYRIGKNGMLSGKKLLAEVGSDGMALDSAGNIYMTAETVVVYSPEGKFIRSIKIPEIPTNVCFGEDGQTLFITARTSLYAVRLDIKGQ